jgi:hypothetical protein
VTQGVATYGEGRNEPHAYTTRKRLRESRGTRVAYVTPLMTKPLRSGQTAFKFHIRYDPTFDENISHIKSFTVSFKYDVSLQII